MSAETIGGLNDRITLLRPEATADEIGGQHIAFITAGDAWARVEASGASGDALYDGEAARAGYRIEIRMHYPVRPGWRVAWRGRTLRVASTAIAGAGFDFLILNCEEELL